MKLNESTLCVLATMICGKPPYTYFPLRRSPNTLTAFFAMIGLDYKFSDPSEPGIEKILAELNNKPSENPVMPPSGIVTVIEGLLSPINFRVQEKKTVMTPSEEMGDPELDRAFEEINELLKHYGLTLQTKDDKKTEVRPINDA